ERADPWDGVFRKPVPAPAGAPLWFADPPQAALHSVLGMHDAEDGGVYRCIDCGHEIWDGTCSACGRVYPGHRHRLHHPWDEDGDGDESDSDGEDGAGMVGWLDGMLPRGLWWGAGAHGGADGEGDEDGEEDGDGDGDEGDVTDVDDEEGFVQGFMPVVRTRLFGGLGSGSEGEGEGEDDEAGYESSFIDDEGAEEGLTGEWPRASPPPDDQDGIADDGGAGEEDGEEEDGGEYVPSALARRSQFVVHSDEEEDTPSEDDGGDSGSDDGLANAVADRERYIYGDDGSVSRNLVCSSSPIHVYSDEDDVADEGHFPLYDDEFAGSEDGDEHSGAPVEPIEGHWDDEVEVEVGDDEEVEHFGYGDEESVHGDDGPASGDEYEYGDALW
ncbi:uncharacterized protein C8Q71DRAFT_727976, partial [Rhodofomes roseus]